MEYPKKQAENERPLLELLPELRKEKENADMDGQMTLFPEMSDALKKKIKTADKNARNWKNAFQKWSDEKAQDGSTSLGCCGYGSMCDYCEDNHYGKPCVRALGKMCRERGEPVINYSDRSEEYFEEVWYGS